MAAEATATTPMRIVMLIPDSPETGPAFEAERRSAAMPGFPRIRPTGFLDTPNPPGECDGEREDQRRHELMGDREPERRARHQRGHAQTRLRQHRGRDAHAEGLGRP